MTRERTEGANRWMYRAMTADSEGRPELGATARTLGARPGRDIAVDEDGYVLPGPDGMSVTLDDPTRMPRPRRPRSLGGEGRDPLFQMRSDLLRRALRLHVDELHPRTAHACVTPAERWRFDEYQGAHHGTRPRWEGCR